MSTWKSLENDQFCNNRRIHANHPMDDKRILTIQYETCEWNIQKIKNKEELPQIITLLKSYYNITQQPGDKKYLDERISAYEKEIEPKPVKEKAKESKPVKAAKELKTPKEKAAKDSKKKVSATLKRLVWNTHVGEEIGKTKCLCCKSTDITQMSFHCGHVTAEVNGGELIVSNLKPICQNCNSSMGTKNMNDFMASFT